MSDQQRTDQRVAELMRRMLPEEVRAHTEHLRKKVALYRVYHAQHLTEARKWEAHVETVKREIAALEGTETSIVTVPA